MVQRPAFIGFLFCVMLFSPGEIHGQEIVRQETTLFRDPLNGSVHPSWKIVPAVFFLHPEFGTLYHVATTHSATPTCGAWAGDETWSNYRVEWDVLCAGEGGGFLGLDFHVSDDGSRGCNIGFYMPKEDGKIAFEQSGRWNGNTSWKLYPFSTTTVPFSKNQWISMCLETGAQCANLYVNGDPTPVYTMYDLAFPRGGIRFWEYHLSYYVRNLRIRALSTEDVKPVLADAWSAVSEKNVIREWQVSSKQDSDFGADGIPAEVRDGELSWKTVLADRRGVVNLIAEYPDSLTPGTVFARTVLKSNQKITRKCWVSYTDRISVWCNDQLVFQGQPRGFYDPGRSPEDGFGRLIPDQFELELPLTTGQNTVLVRSQLTEPLWGWAYWMRLD